MKTVNSLSGGRTSSYIAIHYPANYNVFSVVCIDRKECAPKDVALRQYAIDKLSAHNETYGEFIATAEDDATLRAMMDLEQLLGRAIVWVRGKSFDQVIDTPSFFGGKPSRLPSWARRYCTLEMKLLPIFDWWFNTIGEKVNMRIGFRFDEFDRMERFFNNSEKGGFKVPVSCKTYGNKMQVHQKFDWRFCSFPLVKNGITTEVINKYWQENNGIFFPAVSNCVGCFHKKESTIAAMCELHPEKMQWFADQEQKGMGTWLDSKKPYSAIAANRMSIAGEVLYEIKELNQSCDSGGCTD